MTRIDRALAVFALVPAFACREPNPSYRPTPALDGGAPASPADASTRDTARPDVAAPDRPREAAAETGAFEYHWIECESGQAFGAMVRGSDPGAFGGAYLHVPAGPPDWPWSAASPALPPDRVEIPVTLGAGGTYVVWVRYWTIAQQNDAWYAGFDRSDLRRFYFEGAFATWAWTRNTDSPDRLQFNGLAPGRRTLILGRGESGPRCDRVLVTNDLQLVPNTTP